jgi:predicted metal-dependent enzyme (double-stranded beta helix superfamily)
VNSSHSFSASELLQRCLALGPRFNAPAGPTLELNTQCTELLNAVVAWLPELHFAAIEPGHAYARRELYRDAHGEVLAMRWAQGRTTAPHDHAGAQGLVFLLDHEYRERHFSWSNNTWTPSETRTLQTPSWVRVGSLHDLCCTGAGTSIHVYFPPIAGMRVFDLARRTLWHVQADTGAWLPDHPSQVLRREHW